MHATIQKTIEDILPFFVEGENVFVVGCDNCAAKCKSGGIPETEEMAKRLEKRGVKVAGWCVPGPSGMSLCKLSNTRKVFNEEYGEKIKEADSFLVLACGQGVHTVMDATDGGAVYPGCDTIFGGETVSDNSIIEYCSLCGECIIQHTGGLCPVTLCSKSLLNGPCGGAKDGKCEVDPNKDCGWQLIYDRLKDIGRLDLLDQYQEPKNYARWSRPRTLVLSDGETTFSSLAGDVTVPNRD